MLLGSALEVLGMSGVVTVVSRRCAECAFAVSWQSREVEGDRLGGWSETE